MIIKILKKPYASLGNIIQYNEKEEKREEQQGELISTNLMGETWGERFEEFSERIDRTKENPILHIPIRLAPGENLTNEQFAELSLTYMKKMSLDPELFPYQVIRHHDVKDGEHVHLVISRTNKKGEYWNLSNDMKISSKIRQELESKYELRRLEGNKFSQDKTLNEINMFAYGGKTSTKSYAKETLTKLLANCSQDKKMDISTFIQSCKESDIHPILNLQNDGQKIAGISFFVQSAYGSHTFKGSQVGCSWNEIKNSLVHFPDDKNFLTIANRLSLEKSLSDENLDLKDMALKKTLTKLIVSSPDAQPSNNFIKSIESLKLTPHSRKALNTFISQSEKGRGVVTPLEYGSQLLDSKASNREYSLFDWEKKNDFKDKKIHIQATRFLIENKENPKAFSWILRYPPVSAKNISLRSHLDSFPYHDNQNNFNRLKEEQKKQKDLFCQTFSVDETSKRRFMNTPLPPAEFEKMKTLMSNINANSPKNAFSFIHKSTENYSTFLREKIGEVCVHSGASPVTSEALYNKFLFAMEKNDLNHALLARFYGVSQKYKPSDLAIKNIDSLVDIKSQKTNFVENDSSSNFFTQLFSKLGDLPKEPSSDPRENIDARKKKKRRIMPNS